MKSECYGCAEWDEEAEVCFASYWCEYKNDAELLAMDRYELTPDNRCPECGSNRITLRACCIVEKEINLATGKPVKTARDGRIRPISRKDKASAYDSAVPGLLGNWLYECRKCLWVSMVYKE